MGFETDIADVDEVARVMFETSLWDLKPEPAKQVITIPHGSKPPYGI